MTKSKTYNTNNFWRSKRTWRTTNTGMNKNVISKLAPYIGKREYYDNYIDYRLYITHEERNKGKAFIETVNGCIGDIQSEGRGYVFTEEQLAAVKSVLGKVRSSWDYGNCCYSCRRLY